MVAVRDAHGWSDRAAVNGQSPTQAIGKTRSANFKKEKSQSEEDQPCRRARKEIPARQARAKAQTAQSGPRRRNRVAKARRPAPKTSKKAQAGKGSDRLHCTLTMLTDLTHLTLTQHETPQHRHDRLRLHGPGPLERLRKVNHFFDLEYEPVLKAVCARDDGKAKAFADQWGYESVETDWRS